MPRGGARPGAGRKPSKPKAEPKKAAPAKAGHTDAAGQKTADAPEGWPFGTQPPAPPPKPQDLSALTPLDYLLSLVRDGEADAKVRMQAAALAAPYVHAKPAPAGKKDAQKAEAGKVASRFSAAAPPKLVAAGGKKV